MNILRRICLHFLLLTVTLGIVGVPRVIAAGEFQEDYEVQYAISPAGTTIVTQTVSLTNKQSNLYPQKYSILIDSKKISNVIAYDNKGIIHPAITQTDGKTQIMLTFNEKVVGLGKVMTFSLRYENTDIAQKNGNIWEINIPGVADSPDLASYTVTLNVPPTFGPNAYMTPRPALGSRWTKDQMIRGGISAAYGTSQNFELELSYFLENPTLTKKLLEVALPPDTGYQKVHIRSITPKPVTVVRDRDGNWIARFELSPSQTVDVRVSLTAAIQLHPDADHIDLLDDPSFYTKSLKYWESDNPEIRRLASVYTTPNAIYDFVSQKLTYDYNRVNQNAIRKGAVQAISAPETAICMEFTDLFIAIARAAGIPAREHVGYAYTTNSRLRPISLTTDVLHAWPEYYDSTRRIWIPVDPTWANTTGGVNYFDKLDFNHITFAIFGAESESPYPAGFYKKSGTNGKDISVKFSDAKPVTEQAAYGISYIFPTTVTSGFPASGTVIIENTTGTAIPDATVTIQSLPYDVAMTSQISAMPPFGKISIPVTVPLKGYFVNGNGMIVTTVHNSSKRFDFTIQPVWYKFMLPIGIVILILCAVTVSAWRQSRVWKTSKK